MVNVLMISGILTVLVFLHSDYTERKDERDKFLKRQNSIYLCKDKSCKHDYFRMYQVVRSCKQRTDSNENKSAFCDSINKLNEDSINELIYCPYCLKSNAEKSKSYSWMKEAPKFPELSKDELRIYEIETDKPYETKIALKSLKITEDKLEEIEEIATYQLHYKLETVDEEKVRDRLADISEQVNLIKSETHVESVHKLADKILTQIYNVTEEIGGIKRSVENEWGN